MKHQPLLSVISPVYGAATLLPELVERISRTVSAITTDYEIILVEDHSPDDSWAVIRKMASSDDHITGISLSRNFGQQNALNAGFDHARGEWIVTLDCDLQDAPEFITDLFQKASEGYDIVFASRRNRKDGWVKKMGSKIFYRVLNYLSEIKTDNTVANFVIYHRRAVEAMQQLGDYYRYYPMINQWVGFNTMTIEVEHQKRSDDKKSSYSFRKRLVLALFTILSFSDKPLRMVLKLGVWLVMFSTLIAVTLVVRYLIVGAGVSGWLSVFLSIWFLSGIIILILGIIGLYLGRMFETAKHRPTYLVREKTNAH